jgi:hypothetical protein
MKKTIKILMFSVLFLIIIFGFLVTITIYPGLIIKNKVEYKNYNVYSTQPIDKKIYPILDSIEKVISRCEIYQPNMKHRIFFCEGSNLFKFIQGKFIKAPLIVPIYTQGNSKIQNTITFLRTNFRSQAVLCCS